MNEQLPLFEMVGQEDDKGVTAIAFVDFPAVGVFWQAFKAQQPQRYEFAATDTEKRIVSGPAMIPDIPIYRNADEFSPTPYYVKYNADTVRQVQQRFHKYRFTNNCNIMHESAFIPQGVYMIEDWIVDRERGKLPPKGFENLPDGTWFVEYKVENDNIWEDVKAGALQGFSIEGWFGQEILEEQADAEVLEEIFSLIAEFKAQTLPLLLSKIAAEKQAA